jgi:hypothetical protein
MKEIVKFVLCVIILIVLWHNIDKLIMIGDSVIQSILDKLISIM